MIKPGDPVTLVYASRAFVHDGTEISYRVVEAMVDEIDVLAAPSRPADGFFANARDGDGSDARYFLRESEEGIDWIRGHGRSADDVEVLAAAYTLHITNTQ